MPQTKRPPSYRLHKARQCAVVTLHGKNHYLGPFGSPDSHEQYARLIARWNAAGQPASTTDAILLNEGPPSVNFRVLKYLEFASGYYMKNGRPTGEIDNIRCALASLKKLFGRTEAQSFGPKDLELVRQAMIDDDLARKTINSRVSRIKRMFRWATKEGLVPSNAYYGLLAVDGLKRGRSLAKDTSPIRPVSEEHVKKECAHWIRRSKYRLDLNSDSWSFMATLSLECKARLHAQTFIAGGTARIGSERP